MAVGEPVPGDELYLQFVERFYSHGEHEIPSDWPEETRQRCEFFLRVNASDEATVERSLLAEMADEGVEARLTLSASERSPLADSEALASGLRDPESARYIVESEIGRGGMGRILLAFDRDFRRRIAMKILRQSSSAGVSRFLEEAQATAQLEHPNVTPVYDVGRRSDGSPFFTMKWIRGRNLEECLSGDDGLSLVRALQILQQVAMGVDYANARGVIHRDLKPENIMVGDYGEVLVVDWGLAKVLGAEDARENVSTLRRDDGVQTLDGAIQGSLPYMAPEQARGDVEAVDSQTDVFGLGAILYRILAGGPVHAVLADSSFEEVHLQARRGDVTPPSQRTGKNVPDELERLCLRALSVEKEKRPASPREFHDEIQEFIEGLHDAERRSAEAARLMEIAEALEQRYESQRQEHGRLLEESRAAQAQLRDYDDEATKAPYWALLEHLDVVRKRLGVFFSETTSAYDAVLSVDPQNEASRARLASLYFSRLEEAESKGDADAAQLYEGLVAQHQQGQFVEALQGTCRFRLISEPPGAAVFLSRYEERGPRFELGERLRLGDAASELVASVERGSYLLEFELCGRRSVRLPLVTERLPEVVAKVSLYEEDWIGEGFVQVPAGESIVGEDSSDLLALPRERVTIEEFFVARYPVRLSEYCEFLNASANASAGGVADEALVPSFGRDVYVDRDSQGVYRPVAKLSGDHPVVALPHEAVVRYCAWRSQQSGRKLRLLKELEWERCARGADGRLYPWGNRFDWAFCKGGRSRAGDPFPEQVGSFPRDESPFGVHDLAGGVRELCAGRYENDHRPCRGGSWFNPFPFIFRADTRTYQRDGNRTTDVGFRLAWSVR